MRKCDFTMLPKCYGKRATNGKMVIDWKSSIGFTVPFIYKDVESEFEIIDYESKTQKAKIKFNEEIFEIATSQLLNCSLGGVVGKHNRDFIYEIGQSLEKKGKGEIVAKLRKGKDNQRHYRIRCQDCSQEYERSESHIRNRGVRCPICGDGISYPTKFVNAMLIQLGVEFKREYIISVAKDKRYDFYLPSHECIIEVHGVQHYRDTGFSKASGRTLEEEQENDRLKEKIAIESGVKYYIVIDARNSTKEWIRDSILNTRFSEMFDLDNIDWEMCDKIATSNLTKTICEMFEENDSSISEKIANKINLSRTTVARHLKLGAEFGWCNYDPTKIQKLNGSNKGSEKARPIICIETGVEFESATDCARVSVEVFGVKMLQSKISKVCNGMGKTHKGYSFKYKDDNGADMTHFLKNEKAQAICLEKQKNPELSTKELATLFSVSRDRVVDYLKKGHTLGLCHYDKDEEYCRENNKKVANLKRKQVEVFKDGVSQGNFESVKFLSDNSEELFGVKFAQCSIREVCNGRKKTHRGYTFKYVEEGGEDECQVA